MFSKWGKVAKDVVDGAVLTLNLNAFEEASAKKIGQSQGDNDNGRLVSRKDALQGAVEEVERKIRDLQKQLQQGT